MNKSVLNLRTITLVVDDIKVVAIMLGSYDKTISIVYNDDTTSTIDFNTHDEAMQVKYMITKLLHSECNYIESDIETI